MNITIINGSNTDAKWLDHENALLSFAKKLETNHQVTLVTIKDLKLNYCTGCWDCWVKTPGVCMHKDDGPGYLKTIVKADMLLYASPIVSGFMSSETKKALDRFIPSVLPLIRPYEGEYHHLKRYDSANTFGVLLFEDMDTDPEAAQIIFENFNRIRKNMRADHFISQLVRPDNMEVLAHEISRY
ncbi:MAG: NAD(P)H-dependent oxidoreductase [Vallitaleaceae bacterium]|jgi:multimeric flavodoxin WrbA|nr:NAD(P)H-dependent oxidoreductase [Vallitaleaceae bacterium]